MLHKTTHHIQVQVTVSINATHCDAMLSALDKANNYHMIDIVT